MYLSLFGLDALVADIIQYPQGAQTGYILTSGDTNGTFQWDNFSNIGVSDVYGTPNEINVVDGLDGSVTLSTPQEIATTSNVTFNSVISNLTGNVTGNLNGNLTSLNPVIFGNLQPDTDGVRIMGSSINKFQGIYALNFYGNATSSNTSAFAILSNSSNQVNDAVQNSVTTLTNLIIAGKFSNLNVNPTIGANLLSLTDNTYDIGTSSSKFKSIYSTNFYGDLTGTINTSIQPNISTLSGLTSINGQTITGPDLAKIYNVTDGIAANNKALVLNSSGEIGTINQMSLNFSIYGNVGSTTNPNIILCAADSGIYGDYTNNRIGFSISKTTRLLISSTGCAVTGDLSVSNNMSVTGTLTIGALSLTTITCTTGNITTINSTTLNNTGNSTCNRYLCQNISGTLTNLDSRHQFIQPVVANDNTPGHYLSYLEISPVVSIPGNTQNVISVYNQSRINPAIGQTLANGYGEYIGLIHNGSGTTSNLSSLYIAADFKASGTITNKYGLYLEEQTAGNNNWSIRSLGLNQFSRNASQNDTVIINNTNTTTGSTTRLLNMYGQSTSQGVYADMGRTNTSELRFGIASSLNQLSPGSAAGNAIINAPGTGRLLLGSDGTETAPLILQKSSSGYPVTINNSFTANVSNFGFLAAGGAGSLLGTQSWPISTFINNALVCNSQIMSTSDIRIKSNIRDITDEEVNKFLTIKPKNFIKNNNTEDPVYGFISQDFYKAGLIDCCDLVLKVGIEEHTDSDGFTSPANGLLTLHNESITALLHATIRKQHQKINELVASLANMQNQLNNVLGILASNNIE